MGIGAERRGGCKLVASVALAVVGLLVLQSDVGAAPEQETCFGARVTIPGTPGQDIIRGSAGPDVIAAGAGDDVVLAGGGNDLICGGLGSDALDGAAGDDRIQGDEDLDGIYGGPGDDEIIGGGSGDFVAYAFSETAVTVDLAAGRATGEGTDRLSGIENIIGSSRNDTLIGDSQENILNGREGNDVLRGQGGILDVVAFSGEGPVTASLATGRATGEGSDRMSGIEGLYGTPANDTLTGNADENHFTGGGGNDTLRGGGGSDTVLFFTAERPVSVNLASGRALGEGVDRLSGIEKLLGSSFNDIIVGDAGQNALFGGAGNDLVMGGGGDDQLFGEVVSDPPGNDRLVGGAGNDILAGLLGDDTLEGGAGSDDRATWVFSPAGVSANLATGAATGEGRDRLAGVEGLAGSVFADTLVGDSRPNVLSGWFGDDRLAGGANDDFLAGGEGTDVLDAAQGDDYCLDTQSGTGCEITGLPSARPLAAVAARQTAVARIALASNNEDLGRPSCQPARRRSSAARELQTTLAKPRRGGRHGTSISPPPRIPPAPARPPRTPASATAATQIATSVSWRPTLFRYNGRRWVRYRQFPRLTATIDFGDATVWSDAKGRPVKQVRAAVGKGRFAWAAEVRQGRSRVFDWAEPHQDRGGKALFGKFCTFSR